MFGYDKINISLSNHWLILILLIAIALIFTIYSYQFTLPPISNLKKSFLIVLRFIALILLISIFFEPILSLQKKVEIQPAHLIFIDNSKSISSVGRKDTLNQIITDLFNIKDLLKENDIRIFSFGSEVNQLKDFNNEQINFDEKTTNISKIFRLNEILKDENKKLNPASITILTDGIITDGANPTYQAEKLGLPVFIFAVGDSTRKKDVFIKNVLFNENIFLNIPTTISTTINNFGFANSLVNVSLLEENKILESQIISLNSSGVNTINFNYLPKEKGERKLQIKVDQLEDESNKSNNIYPFFINVSEDKTRILLISGSPNPDLTFIKNTLETDENYLVNSFTQIEPERFLEQNFKTKLDSADILFLINFPNKFTSDELFNQIKNKILTRKTPFFLIINNDVDFNKIKQIENELPIKLENVSDNYIKAQPDINFSSTEKFDLINNIADGDWNKLPPILFPPNLASAKAESRVISYIKTETNKMRVPLIVQRNIASSRSICFIGKEFWRWKLQTAINDLNLFDVLILNSAKWLSVLDGKRQFKVRTLKKFYSAIDEIEFVAEFYDELLNPINSGNVEINIKGEKESKTLQLTELGNGLYEGKIALNNPGDYSFTAKAILNNSILHTAAGKFNVGDVDVEMLDLRMNYELLSELSKRTKGDLFSLTDFDSYLKKIKEINKRTSSVKTLESQIKLWSNEILLIVVIILFSIEWFIRKQSSLV